MDRIRSIILFIMDKVGKPMEVDVDDMLVKSKETKYHVKHLGEMFNILRK